MINPHPKDLSKSPILVGFFVSRICSYIPVMKRYIPLLALLLTSLLYPQSKMDINNLIERNGLLYTLNDNKPYTGKVFSFNEKGHKESEMTYKNGKQDGLFTYWHENGKKKWEGSVNDGKPDGLLISWNERGQKTVEETYKDGKQDGKLTFFYENGQKELEETYKDGKKNGLSIGWNESGQKWTIGTYKDGKKDGKWTYWHENGQKELEGTYKDGELMVGKHWDENGNLILTVPPQ